MTLKKILRYVIRVCLAIVILLVLFLAFSIAPVNRTPISEYDFYSAMKQRLARLDTVQVPEPAHGFKVGYAKVNLTPSFQAATAGYGNRRGKLFEGVHDSIYVRAMVVDNGTRKVAIVSADLIIIPPTVTRAVGDKLSGTEFNLDNTFLGATHTHNSIGNWGTGATQFLYGDYNEAMVHFIADKIVSCIQSASGNVELSTLRTGTVAIPQAVSNRLVHGGVEDALLRSIEIERSDSSKLLFLSFTAHATCLFSKDLGLSRDYPGKLVDTLEAQGYEFAMFMAGAVGSHTFSAPEAGPDCIDWMASEISSTFLSTRSQLVTVQDSSVAMLRVPLLLGDPQVKITPNLKVRSWLFRTALGEYPVHLTALRLGDVILLGTPCDFSGEFDPQVDSVASALGVKAMVTSFNGGYIGYVTPVRRYDIDHYETQLMNWYAPGTGEYMRECLISLMDVLSQ